MPDLKIVVSKTGAAHGWGSDPYKWVSFLTLEERALVFDTNVLVVITQGVPETPGFPNFRVVRAYGRRLFHRVPEPQLWPAIEAKIKETRGA